MTARQIGVSIQMQVCSTVTPSLQQEGFTMLELQTPIVSTGMSANLYSSAVWSAFSATATIRIILGSAILI